MIKRPMKAPTDPITDEQLQEVSYPLVGSFKLDGFRCCIKDNALTSSMKPIQNRFIQRELSKSEYKGLDGELLVGAPYGEDVFNRSSGPLRRYEGEPDFRFYVFDNFISTNSSYYERWIKTCVNYTNKGRIVVMEQVLLRTLHDVLEYEKLALSIGYEGIMIRSPFAPYKEGRSTFKEGYIYKRKPFVDTEATIVGFVEQQHNLNKQEEDYMGLMKRSSHKENKVGKDTLGAFILLSPLWNTSFSCGTGKGLTDALRQFIWDNKDGFMGKTVTIKYQKYGSIDAPRLPIFKGFGGEILNETRTNVP
jgi:DNA ligase-1